MLFCFVLFYQALLTITMTGLVNLASIGCAMNCWLSCRVSSLHSVGAGSISIGGDQGIHF